MMRSTLLLASLASIGCARKREPAPAEMEQIASFMLSVWEDDRSLEDAMVNLAPWLEENSTAEDAQDGYRLTPLPAENVATLDHPERVFDGLLGAAVAGVSPHDIQVHAQTMVLDDQVFSNPRNYEAYLRSVSGDATLFTDAEEGRVDTVNDITTSNFGVTIPYTLNKDYKWVYARDIGPAIIARSWIPEVGCNESGENCLQLSFSIDLWYEATPGETIRFTSTWSEVTSSLDGVIGDDLRIAALASGMANVFDATDSFISEGGLD